MRTAFGIDFGTTNTRIAFYDGRRPIVVPVRDRRGTAYQIPSVVGYRDGKAVAFGRDALADTSLTLCTSIKWLAAKDAPVEIDGHEIAPEEVMRDFFGYLKKVVRQTRLVRNELDNAAITMPVNYPYRAREALLSAMREAGITVDCVYQEPVAALYCDIHRRRLPGYAAVFDWGGGTLDVAVVRVEDGRAQVRSLGGLERGGDHFDNLVLENALSSFEREYPDLPLSMDDLLKHPQRGPKLKLEAEKAKITLSTEPEADVSSPRLVGERHLYYPIRQRDFESWIKPDIDRALEVLRRAAKSAGVAPGVLNPLLLSGGTSNIPAVQARIKTEFPPEHVDGSLPSHGSTGTGAPELDVANATAIGAAMLSVWNASPVFAREVGIRIAGSDRTMDRFLPVFGRGEPVDFHEKRTERLFVTDASTGVARVLVCDRADPVVDKEGELRRILSVPIDRSEHLVDVSFSMDKHLMLKVHASGRVACTESRDCTCWIPNIPVGFEIPAEDQRD